MHPIKIHVEILAYFFQNINFNSLRDNLAILLSIPPRILTELRLKNSFKISLETLLLFDPELLQAFHQKHR